MELARQALGPSHRLARVQAQLRVLDAHADALGDVGGRLDVGGVVGPGVVAGEEGDRPVGPLAVVEAEHQTGGAALVVDPARRRVRRGGAQEVVEPDEGPRARVVRVVGEVTARVAREASHPALGADEVDETPLREVRHRGLQEGADQAPAPVGRPRSGLQVGAAPGEVAAQRRRARVAGRDVGVGRSRDLVECLARTSRHRQRGLPEKSAKSSRRRSISGASWGREKRKP